MHALTFHYNQVVMIEFFRAVNSDQHVYRCVTSIHQCDSWCDAGTQSRSVWCVKTSSTSAEKVDLQADDETMCDSETRPPTARPCPDLIACDRRHNTSADVSSNWVVTAWIGVSIRQYICVNLLLLL